jgi:aldehyde:ferredoxin oxidoreductase
MTNHERALIIDLSQRTYWIEDIDQKMMTLYLGGRGLGARLLAQFLPADTDPLAASNPLIFVAGPLQGTRAPFSSKTVLCTKSPLTGIYLFSVASGTLGHHLTRCGYKALVIVGASKDPLYLWMNDSQVEFREGTDLWGRPLTEAYQLLLQEVGGNDLGTAMIGPAGERLVRYATVITELPRKRSFGRGGAGAVMGAKKLKAVVVSSEGMPPIADEEGYQAARRVQIRAVTANRRWRGQRKAFGTTTSMPNLQEYGMLPTRNWQRGSFEAFEEIGPMAFGDRWVGESNPCAPFCPAPCAKTYHVPKGDYAGLSSEGPDYETIYAFGTNCAIDRFDALIAMDHLCDEMGLDTISAGVTLAFIMECFERGLLKGDDTGGLELSFGDHRGALEALKQIATRSGFGDLMAEGVRRCASHIGQGSEEFAMHAQGLELGGWGCRAAYGQALQCALSPRGGCHHDLGIPAKMEWGSPEATRVKGKGKLVIECASKRIVRDSAIQCAFAGLYFDLDLMAELLEAITGQPFDVPELMRIGERILNLERLLNLREGVNRSTDRLPKRLLAEPLPDGPRKGSTVPLERLKDDLYEAAGWDQATGLPTLETLRRLGLDEEMMRVFSLYLSPDRSMDGAHGDTPVGP